MKRPKRVRPVISVHEEKGSTAWVSLYTRPMNGDPEVIEFRGFACEADALAFKSDRQRSLRDIDCLCLTRERPDGVPPQKGHHPK